MPTSPKVTIAELLFWSYANLAMAEMAVHNRDLKYSQKHYMVRARLYSGLIKGTMSPRSLMRDQRIRMTLPQECIYCGATNSLSIDHVISTHLGGADTGDNAVWACRRCNSSESGRDLFAWWFECCTGFPPLFVIRIYLTQAIAYCIDRELVNLKWAEVSDQPFSFRQVPTKYPDPPTLTFSPYHSRRTIASD